MVKGKKAWEMQAQIRLGKASSSVVRNLDFTKQAGGILEGPWAECDDEGFIEGTLVAPGRGQHVQEKDSKQMTSYCL